LYRNTDHLPQVRRARRWDLSHFRLTAALRARTSMWPSIAGSWPRPPD